DEDRPQQLTLCQLPFSSSQPSAVGSSTRAPLALSSCRTVWASPANGSKCATNWFKAVSWSIDTPAAELISALRRAISALTSVPAQRAASIDAIAAVSCACSAFTYAFPRCSSCCCRAICCAFESEGEGAAAVGLTGSVVAPPASAVADGLARLTGAGVASGAAVASGTGVTLAAAAVPSVASGAVPTPATAAANGVGGGFIASKVLGTPHARMAAQKKIVAAMVLRDICVYYRTLDRFRTLTFTFGDQHMSVTRFRTGAAALAAALVVALLAFIPSFSAPASAASPAVGVGTPTNRFTPNVVTIPAGGTVTFNWVAGTHTVVLPSGAAPDLTINSANPTGTTTALETPATYYYYCSINAEASDATEAHVEANDAMVGKIIVLAADATPPPATTSPTQASPTTPPAATSPSATAPSNGQCILTVKDQAVTADSKTIIIPKSQQGRAGYIAIHESSATGAPGPVIGVTAYQPAGSVYTNLPVTLDRALKNGET